MINDADDHLQNIACKLLALKSMSRLTKADRETLETIVSVEVPAIQTLLKNERKTQKSTG